MRTLLLSLALSLLAASSPAAAQDRTGQVTTYRFDDDLVTGETVSPDGIRLWLRGERRLQTLIRARAHFVPELAKSVENL